MTSAIESSALEQIIGRRAEQQDMLAEGVARLSGGASARLFVVADGMGGHSGGAVASALALNAFLAVAESGVWASYAELLHHALMAANRAIGEHARMNPSVADMGSTLVAAAIDGRELNYISVGDSPLFSLGPTGLERVNADHSMAPLIDAAIGRGEMTIEEAREHPQRSALRSALSGKPIALVDDGCRTLAGGEILIMASDGLLTLSEAEIVDIVAAGGRDAATILAKMLDTVEARARADQDNCSVAIVALVPPPPLAKRGRRWRFFGWGALLAGIAVAALAWIAVAGVDFARSDTGAPDEAGGDAAAAMPEGSPRRPGYADLPPASLPPAKSQLRDAPEPGGWVAPSFRPKPPVASRPPAAPNTIKPPLAGSSEAGKGEADKPAQGLAVEPKKETAAERPDAPAATKPAEETQKTGTGDGN